MKRIIGIIAAAALLLGAAPEPKEAFFPAFTVKSSYHLPLFQILRGERIVIPVTPQNSGGDITVPGLFVDGDTDTGITATGTLDELAIVSGQSLLAAYRRDYRFGRGGFLNGRATFAYLGLGTDGTQIWCSDCDETDPCSSGGSGALAIRSSSTWNCSALGAAGASFPLTSDTTIANSDVATYYGDGGEDDSYIIWETDNGLQIAVDGTGDSPAVSLLLSTYGADTEVSIGTEDGDVTLYAGGNATMALETEGGDIAITSVDGAAGLTLVEQQGGVTTTIGVITPTVARDIDFPDASGTILLSVGPEELNLSGTAFASLGASADGTVKYCSNCDPSSTPCTTGGASTGNFAWRENGAWNCK